MKEILVAFFSAVVLFLLYDLFLICRVRFAKKELALSGLSWKMDGEIHMEAMPKSAEYYIRMAIWASDDGRVPIVIHIRKNDENKKELLFIAEKMARRHLNLSVRLT